MYLAALLLSLPLQQASGADLTAFQRQAEMTLLSGDRLAPDYRQQLLTLPPEDRIEAIIFLRRIGLLTGKRWRVDDMLRPAQTEGNDQP